MDRPIAELLAEQGANITAVRARVVELSELPHKDVKAIEAGLKSPSTFPTLDAEKYQGVSLRDVVTETHPAQLHVLRFLVGYKSDVERASLHLLREQRWRLVDKVGCFAG
jgi:hypothetical protein